MNQWHQKAGTGWEGPVWPAHMSLRVLKTSRRLASGAVEPPCGRSSVWHPARPQKRLRQNPEPNPSRRKIWGPNDASREEEVLSSHPDPVYVSMKENEKQINQSWFTVRTLSKYLHEHFQLESHVCCCCLPLLFTPYHCLFHGSLKCLFDFLFIDLLKTLGTVVLFVLVDVSCLLVWDKFLIIDIYDNQHCCLCFFHC